MAHLGQDVVQKRRALADILRGLGCVVIAFSGGVDSAFLLAAAQEVLGDAVLAVTADSPAIPQRELWEAQTFCTQRGIRQIIFPTHELELAQYRKNVPDRCYYCKRAMFEQITEIAAQNDMVHIAEGSNVDDTGDFRPGMRAIRELHIRSPLREAGLTKADIRALSRDMGLPTADKPSFACLASRFAYGEPITRERLQMVERAEQLLHENGFGQLRVRVHGTLARIEVLPEELERLLSMREEIVCAYRQYGFSYVTIDLQGYRTGSMNEVL